MGVGGTSPDDGVLPRTRVLLPRHRLFTEAVAVVYIVVAAQCDGRHYLFFPGLAALAYDVLTRPWGKWASQPARLVLTPSVAAVAGVWTTRQFPYHFLTVVGLVTGCLLVVAALGWWLIRRRG